MFKDICKWDLLPLSFAHINIMHKNGQKQNNIDKKLYTWIKKIATNQKYYM